MPRYRHIGDQPRSFPELGLDLEPGQEFETEQPVSHPDLQLLDDEPDATPAQPVVDNETSADSEAAADSESDSAASEPDPTLKV